MSYKLAEEKLSLIRQTHVLRFWQTLNQDQKTFLTRQVQDLNIDCFIEQQNLIHSVRAIKHPEYGSFRKFSLAGSVDHFNRGNALFAQGLAACVLVAGGQATRLQFSGPKGLFPVSVVKGKSLFQIFAEKTAAASRLAERALQLAIMTSPLNHETTVKYFKDHRFFGLAPEQIHFYPQSMLPLLTDEGNLFLEEPGKIAYGPDGNGGSLHELYRSGIGELWEKQGIRFVNFIMVDNPLADPFDAELTGFHQALGNEISIKCVERQSDAEEVGVLVEDGKQVKVIEYSELPQSEKTARLEDGSLKHLCANISMFCFSLAFIRSTLNNPLPLHLARKSYPRIDENGLKQEPSLPNSWKYETYIFDLLPMAHRVQALLYSRANCFAPLKNATGRNSLKEVQEALQERDKAVFKQVTGLNPPPPPFELTQDFYYPTKAFINKWHTSAPPQNSYIQ